MARKDASPLPIAATVTAVLALGALLAAGGPAGAPHGSAGPKPVTLAPVGSRPTLRRLALSPLAFEQPSTPDGAFVARGRRYTVAAAGDGWAVTLGTRRRSVLSARLDGARPGRRGTGTGRLPGRVNYLVGSDHSRWRTGVGTYARAVFAGVYRGTDLIYHGTGGALEYDFRLAPGTDPGRIRIQLSGARSLRVARNGDLVARLPAGSVRQHRPAAYQWVAGARRRVAARFVLAGSRVGFQLGRYDRSRPLVIDPSLAFGDFVGGTAADAAQKVALDGAGNIYIAGISASASIAGATVTRSRSSGNEAFVLKLSPSGQRQWISYLGGSGDDRANDIALDSSGRAYITGSTDSPDFPAAGKFASTNNCSAVDAYVARFNTDGTLSYASFGGTGDTADVGYGIAVEGDGNAYITDSLQLYDSNTCAPTTTVGNVLRYDADGNFQWYILSPQSGNDIFSGIGVTPGCASNCDIYVTGRTTYQGNGGPYTAAAVYKYSTDPVPANVAKLWGRRISRRR